MINQLVRQTVIEDRRGLLVIGDSTSAGSNGATGAGPTPTIDTSFFYDRASNILRIMNPDFVNAPSGTQFPKACIDFYAATGKKLLVIPSGLGGSYITNTGSNWSPSGAQYALAQSDYQKCFAKLTIPSLLGIYISLSVNDATDVGVSLASIDAAWTSLITRLQTDYPGVPIAIDKIGVDAGTMSSKIATVQGYIDALAVTFSGVTIIEGMSVMQSLGYMADGKHPNQTGNNYRGALIADWLETLV